MSTMASARVVARAATIASVDAITPGRAPRPRSRARGSGRGDRPQLAQAEKLVGVEIPPVVAGGHVGEHNGRNLRRPLAAAPVLGVPGPLTNERADPAAVEDEGHALCCRFGRGC